MTDPAETFRIRPATLDDLDTLVDFADRLAAESEGRRPDPDRLRAGVRRLLNEPPWFGLMARDASGLPAGALLVGGHEWSDWSNGLVWLVTGLYVEPQHRRTGLAQQLLEHLERLARATEPPIIAIRGAVREDSLGTQRALDTIGHRRNGYVVMEKRLV